jgi:two-component system, chemotaxis family, chemotaxis protein CheY
MWLQLSPFTEEVPKQTHPALAQVMIVEDNADLRETLADLLALEGYRIEGVAHGQAALAHLREAPPPRLILLDLMMPVMNGWEFLRELRWDPHWAAIPVVVMSAIADEEAVCRLQGVAACLRKPVDIEELLKLAARYCR